MQASACGLQAASAVVHALLLMAVNVRTCGTVTPVTFTGLFLLVVSPAAVRPMLLPLQNQYGKRKVHPTARAALERLFAGPNRQLAALLQRNDLGWAGLEGA